MNRIPKLLNLRPVISRRIKKELRKSMLKSMFMFFKIIPYSSEYAIKVRAAMCHHIKRGVKGGLFKLEWLKVARKLLHSMV